MTQIQRNNGKGIFSEEKIKLEIRGNKEHYYHDKQQFQMHFRENVKGEILKNHLTLDQKSQNK